MMNQSLPSEKLVILPFQKISNDSGVLEFERCLLYGVVGKLALFTDLNCKDLATRTPENMLDPDQTVDQQARLLKKLCESYQSRYVMTGSLLRDLDDDGNLAGIKVALRLYDVSENRYVKDSVQTVREFEAEQTNPERLVMPMAVLNELMNWAVFEVLEKVVPNNQELEAMADYEFANSYEALCKLITADYTELTNGNIDEKLAAYQAALALDPAMEIAYYNLGKLYKTVNQYRESVVNYRKAVENCKGTRKIKGLYATEAGIGCALLGQYEPAIKWWLKAIEFNPLFINPYMNIAMAYEELDRLEEAEAYFLKAQEMAPNDLRSYYSLARIYSKTGSWEKAINQYQHQLQVDSDDPWCHSNIATCYLQLDDMEKAAVHFEKTAELDPAGEAGQYASLILNELIPSG